MKHNWLLAVVAVLLMVFATMMFVGCEGDKTVINVDLGDDDGGGDDDDDTDDDTDDDDDTGESDFEVLRSAADGFVSGEGAPYVVPATDLYNILNDGNAGNDYFVISVRKPEHYAAGHVCGDDGTEAINIPWLTVADSIDQVPDDTDVIVYCYTGHTQCMTQMWLGMLGYSVYAMKFGMMGWNYNYIISEPAFDPDTAPHYDTCDGSQELVDEYDFPEIDTGEDNDYDIILARAKEVLQEITDGGGTPPVVKAADLETWINDGEPSTDVFILDIRKTADYESAHICGSDVEAYNIWYADVFKTDNLKYLPTDQKIVVVCYTGHTASQVAFALRLMGYDAYALKFAMMGWDYTKMGSGQNPYNPDTAPTDDVCTD